MGTAVLLLLLVMAKLYQCHVIYTKEPTRYRVAYEDWKPVRDSPLRHIRYPVYHKNNGYGYISGKRVIHQAAEQSEKIEVFSPAPPTILGSFSVFGHATVNAREHASQMNKKLPRPQLSDYATAETRPKVSNYQYRHHYPSAYPSYHHSDVKRPSYTNEYNEPSYFYEASLRPPPHEQTKAYTQTSMSPISYYGYEQGQIYHDDKFHKPQKAHNSYRHNPSVYSPTLGDYKTTMPPTQYDSTYSYYNGPHSQIDAEYYNENQGGPIALSIKSDSKSKPVTENNDHIPHFGRPFQSTPSYTTSEALKNNFDPYVTTFPSSPTVETKVKFSDVAQPFRVSHVENIPFSSAQPDNSQPIITEEVYPLSVTTIDVPIEGETQEIKSDYDAYEPKHRTPFKPSPYDHSSHKLTVSSYQNYDNTPTFLPTPSTDISPYLTEPKNEITTISPAVNTYQETNSISSIEEKIVESSEAQTEIYSTVPIETTTKSKPIKSRRPSRPVTSSTTTASYNHYFENDYKYQRRRKPSNNKVRTRDSLEKNNFIKQRTTTTTTTTITPAPINEEESPVDQTTELPVSISDFNNPEIYEYTGDKIEHTNTKEQISDINNENQDRSTKAEEIPTTTSTTTTASPTVVATQVSTTTQVSIEPGTRLKSRYGNRPRFSIKDYREKLNKATSTISPHESEKTKAIRNETEFKFRRTKPSKTIARTTTESPDSTRTTEPKFQKYKPRIGPSRYKTTSTTTTPEADGTTTERSNTFKPNANRYKPGNIYYSRYRTSTSPPKQSDENQATTKKTTVKPKGVFSAKRQPFPLKSKPTLQTTEENEEQDIPVFPETLKTNENEVNSAVITKKMDDATTTVSSGFDEAIEKDTEKEAPASESQRIADLTSSSSNEFHQPTFYNPDKLASKRPLSKITLPTDNPILPLEAFFQTQHK